MVLGSPTWTMDWNCYTHAFELGDKRVQLVLPNTQDECCALGEVDLSRLQGNVVRMLPFELFEVDFVLEKSRPTPLDHVRRAVVKAIVL